MAKGEKFTERQVKILLALANAGSEGLPKKQIMEAWGWDGTKLDETRFSYDWDKMNCVARLGGWPDDCMVYGPYFLGSDYHTPRFFLSGPGRNFLIENHII